MAAVNGMWGGMGFATVEPKDAASTAEEAYCWFSSWDFRVRAVGLWVGLGFDLVET